MTVRYNRHDYCYDPEHTHNTIDMTVRYNRHDYCYDPEHTHNTIDMTVRYNRHDYCYDPETHTQYNRYDCEVQQTRLLL